MAACCVKGFHINGTPSGKEGYLAQNQAYISGSNEAAAVLLIHDLFGWTFSNTRLLADRYAEEANVTVYVPDLYAFLFLHLIL